ncbi:unnamed protein product [Nippostrongylus brasiliensis]|uniref:Reverse transcriptase n=1 Tax=Nippostrongylus brasiliensis TaxID=27835 RepID=A0A0N4XUD5_NIPBR|nr:unnamed protein product [Nippostrongylus brasiliensis]
MKHSATIGIGIHVGTPRRGEPQLRIRRIAELQSDIAKLQVEKTGSSQVQPDQQQELVKAGTSRTSAKEQAAPIPHYVPPTDELRVLRGGRLIPDLPAPPDLGPLVDRFVQELFPFTTTGHTSCSQSSNDSVVLQTLKEVMKSQVIPELGVYDGTGPPDHFIRQLELKYPTTVWSEEDRIKILLNHISGTAKAIVASMPEEGRNSSFEDIVAQLRLMRYSPGERLQAESEWENLRMYPDETVVDFSCRLQQIASRMAPGCSMNFQLACKMYKSLASWEGSYHMLTALEASEDRVFSEVRAVALRLERMRNLQKAASTSGNTCPSEEPSTTDRVCPPRPEKPFIHGNMGTPRDQRGRKGGNPPQGSSKPHQRGNTGNPPIATPTQPNSRPSKPNTNQTFAKELQFRCAKSISRLRIKSKAYGKPCTCSLQLLGTQAKALVDSGSVLSIIPSGFFFRLISEGVDLDPLVTMVGPAQSTKVRDASGNSMSFLMRVEISVSLAGGRDTKVQFHVQKADKELILLGTNALQALGVGIQFTPTGAKLTHTGRKLRQVAIRAAKAAREITIPPLSVAKIEITHPCKQANEVFWSQDDRIGSGVCHVENGSTVVTAVNKENQPWTIRKGQCLGEWSSDSWFDPKTKDIPGDMLEIRRADVLPEPARVNQILDILQGTTSTKTNASASSVRAPRNADCHNRSAKSRKSPETEGSSVDSLPSGHLFCPSATRHM